MESGCLPPSSTESPCPRLAPSHRILSGFGEPPFPPEAARWCSLGRACPHVAAAHPHHGQTLSALQSHPNICHLKLFHNFNDFGRDSPPCCGGRGTAPFPAGAAGWREPRNRREPPDAGDPGTAVPPAGMLPSPGWQEDVQRSVLFVVGSVPFNRQPGFPLSSVFPPARSRKGLLTAMALPPPSPPSPQTSARPACRSSLEKA